MVICPAAYVEFKSDLPLAGLAAQLSTKLFADIPFVGENDGIWDEVPALRLEKRFLGLEVVIGGNPGMEGGYTLQIEAPDFPWSEIAANQTSTGELTTYVRHLVGEIEGALLQDDH